jgi:hypothetical protein
MKLKVFYLAIASFHRVAEFSSLSAMLALTSINFASHSIDLQINSYSFKTRS